MSPTLEGHERQHGEEASFVDSHFRRWMCDAEWVDSFQSRQPVVHKQSVVVVERTSFTIEVYELIKGEYPRHSDSACVLSAIAV